MGDGFRFRGRVGSIPVTPAAVCQPHQAPATGTCARCGVFVCDGCTKWQAEKRLCAGCFSRLGEKPSKEANLALLLSTFGLCLGVPGIFGLWLAQRELGRIRRGESPAAGEANALLARTIGVVSLVMLAFGVVWAVQEFAP
ncbi:MAG: hypothetical protein AMXMBFR34_04800 [Myxococcaceae bacterium]